MKRLRSCAYKLFSTISNIWLKGPKFFKKNNGIRIFWEDAHLLIVLICPKFHKSFTEFHAKTKEDSQTCHIKAHQHIYLPQNCLKGHLLRSGESFIMCIRICTFREKILRSFVFNRSIYPVSFLLWTSSGLRTCNVNVFNTRLIKLAGA